MSLADVTSARSSPAPEACPECDTSASVTSDLHKYQVACTCKPSAQYACADDPGPPPPAKTDTPPALPPRPPTSVLATNRRNNAAVGCSNESSCRRRKYAWWCVGCGALAAALGGLLAAQHILLRAYTASPQHLETVPAAVPAAMLVLTGVCIMSLARRRNRYSYMIKVVGVCCLVCALTCVLVTITTTVIHMNKLQTLKFCDYTIQTRTCTCYSLPFDTHHRSSEDDGVRCVFEGVTSCDVVHGALYWCLRGVFALSVSAVLVCIFSSMLAYQLLSHERKKMYWEQLELRCRSLYRPPAGQAAPAPGRPVQSNCSCCAQCHPTQAWDISLQHRFWAPGRIGNLYSPNPGTGRKTSAWSWFPWPRSNSQNSRCRMGGVPQSGDSAYGFCDTDTNVQNPQTYDERFPNTLHRQNPQFAQNQSLGQFAQNQNIGQFAQNQQFGQASYQEGFGEASGSFDAQTGVWGPPPPYSPQGRSGSRHHLHHPDPAAATLLHHHHLEAHRNSIHDHNLQPHTCRNSYIPQNLPDMSRMNPELARMNPELARINPELARLNPELARLNPDLARLNPDLARLNPELARLNPEMARLNPELARMNPELSRINSEIAHLQMYPGDVSEMARMQSEMHIAPEARFNTLRGHLVPYRSCQRNLGMSAGNLHRDCRMEESVTIECLHSKSGSKVSDQSTDSSQKQGKENLGFQNDKHSPIRSSMQDCHRNGQNAESEVYFADVSSCCNVSVKADCCINPTVSALVGTIENHPESTSESDTGSFTLTRQQRPQPQVGSKRRPRQNEKHLKSQEKRDLNNLNNSLRLTEQQIEQLNNSMRMCERVEGRNERDRMTEARCERVEGRNERDRLTEARCERVEGRNDRDRINEVRCERIEPRCDRIIEARSDREPRCERTDRSIIEGRCDRMNEARCERDRMIEARCIDRDRITGMNDSRISGNESRVSDRGNDSRMSERSLNDSRLERMSERLNDSRIEDRRMSDMNSSFRLEGSPKIRTHMSPLRIARSSPKNLPKEHPRQSSSDSGKADFFPPNLSPLSPNTEESLLSDEDRPDTVYSNEPETSKCLAPDSQYEAVKEKEEILKTNHHHCYSDTNTMDSGWQSGSEKQVTD